MKNCNVRRLYDVVERIVEYTFGLEKVPARKFYHDRRQFVFITEAGLLYVLLNALTVTITLTHIIIYLFFFFFYSSVFFLFNY
jgi:hypothetical protein